MTFQQVTPLTLDRLDLLLTTSLEEGYGFIQKLWDEYASGKTTFTEKGAMLLGKYDDNDNDERLIAIGGLHRDPYLALPRVGRIRHVYVLPEYRRQRLGRQLMQALITHAATDYDILTLRTLTAHGHSFYTSLGFSDAPRFENASHFLEMG